MSRAEEPIAEGPIAEGPIAEEPSLRKTVRRRPLVEFLEVLDTSSEEFEKAMDIYIASFPENERRPVATIEMEMKSGISRLIIGRMEDRVVLMALLHPINDTSFVLGDYMAIDEEYRGMGIGAAFLNNIFSILDDIEFDYLLGEIESPYLEEDELKARRVEFFRRLGMKELKDVRYILPPLQGTLPTEMILMVLCKTEADCLGGAEIKDILRRVFRNIYARGEDDEILALILERMPDTIKLV
jgi:GNAT superfamily N-acetyltransferase